MRSNRFDAVCCMLSVCVCASMYALFWALNAFDEWRRWQWRRLRRLMKAATTSNECLNKLATIHNLLTITFGMHAFNSISVIHFQWAFEMFFCLFVCLFDVCIWFGIHFTLLYSIAFSCLCIEHLCFPTNIQFSSCNTQHAHCSKMNKSTKTKLANCLMNLLRDWISIWTPMAFLMYIFSLCLFLRRSIWDLDCCKGKKMIDIWHKTIKMLLN